MSATTWYWQGGVDSNWSTLSNWWDSDGGTGSNPTVAPWTDSSTAADSLTLSSTHANTPIIDVTIGAADSSWAITGACDIGSIYNTSIIYDGTWTGDYFQNNGNIYNGTFTGGYFGGGTGGIIWGGTHTGENASDSNLINGGTFTCAYRVASGNIFGGTWNVTSLVTYGAIFAISNMPSTMAADVYSSEITITTCYGDLTLEVNQPTNLSGEFFESITFNGSIMQMGFYGTYHQDIDLLYLWFSNIYFDGIFLGNVSAPASSSFSGTFWGNISLLGQSYWSGATVYGNVSSDCRNNCQDVIGSSDSTFYGDVSQINGQLNNYIGNGATYYGSVTTDNTCWIQGGTFYGSVSSGTNINGGDFYGSVAWGTANFMYFLQGGFIAGNIHNLTPTVAGGKVAVSLQGGSINFITNRLPQLDVIGTGGL